MVLHSLKVSTKRLDCRRRNNRSQLLNSRLWRKGSIIVDRVSNRCLNNVNNKVATIFLRLFLKLSFCDRLIGYTLTSILIRLLTMFN